ncbi:MAG: hypothetical protein KDC54_19470 [Lewinella sp.]|nr:hypothetical protein [Lewinella sp.]
MRQLVMLIFLAGFLQLDTDLTVIRFRNKKIDSCAGLIEPGRIYSVVEGKSKLGLVLDND